MQLFISDNVRCENISRRDLPQEYRLRKIQVGQMYLNCHFQVPVVPLQNVSAHREVFDAGEVLEMIVYVSSVTISDGSNARDLKIRSGVTGT